MAAAQQPSKKTIAAGQSAQQSDLMQIYKAIDKNRTAPRPLSEKPAIEVTQVIDELERERKQLENRDFAQNTQLKRRTLNLLFIFLAAETLLIFAFAFAQATGWPNRFHLEDFSFKLLVIATIAQITGMLFVAVRYLFPKK